MQEIINTIKKRKILYVFLFVILVSFFAFKFIARSFSLLEPVRSVEIFSNNVSYFNNEPGAWKVTKSASWTGVGRARITVDVDSVLKVEEGNYKDIIMVLDISGSMNGDKLNRVKTDSIDLINSVLSDNHNRIALITFDSSSTLVSGLTNDKDSLINSVNSLSSNGSTNYYAAFKNVNVILKDYVKKSNRDCVVLFLTDGYPNMETPNQIGEYHYLKDTYPYVTFNGIQYEMGNTVLDPIKEVSDYQYIANVDTLNNILFEASIAPIVYDEFTFTDYIDTNFFNIASIDNVNSEVGTTTLDGNKVTWTIKDGLRTGSKASLMIDITLKDEYLNSEGAYPTNSSETITSRIIGNDEDVNSTLTPVLQTSYSVSYDGNVPSGCTVNNVPSVASYSVFSTVKVSDEELVCSGYQFKGWEIVTSGVKMINDDYFIMPESDVILRGVWSKLSISKSIDGTVYEKLSGHLMKQLNNNNFIFGKALARSSIESVTFVNSIQAPSGVVDSWDVSVEQNGSIFAWYIENERGLYDLYIGQEEGVVANDDSSYLFYGMSNLKSIQGFEYFDTTNVTSMRYMFYNCNSLESLNVSSFETGNVTNMASMFYNCSSLESLNLNSFETGNVTNMSSMFSGCSGLTSLDLSSFETGKVINMSSMFSECSSLTSLNLNSFDTKNVTNMSMMFSNCSGLESLDLSSFETVNVTNMSNMFNGCSGLTSLDLSRFNTGNVTNMSNMFNGCRSLESLDLSYFNTEKVTTMGYMFDGCSGLTSLNVSSFDTSEVTAMSFMFRNCRSLTNLNLRSFDVSKVTSDSRMFYNMSSKADGMMVYVKDATVQAFVLGTNLVPNSWDTENVVYP